MNEQSNKLYMKADSLDGQLTKAHTGDAGMDIRAMQGMIIQPGQGAVLNTSLRIALPEGTVGIIKGRSGLSIKHGIECCNAGVIDEGFRGEIMLNLYNHAASPYVINKGDRVAQLLVLPVIHCDVILADELPESSDGRGENGYGSSGLQ